MEFICCKANLHSANFGSCLIWRVPDLDFVKLELCKIKVLQNLVPAKFVPCKTWIVSTLYKKNFESCIIWIVEILDRAKFGS